MPESIQIPRIKKLSSSLANQIAAGEVIERPASVIKELLENCLDAGASRIVVDVSKAGSQLIRVTDNGHGIHPDDLQLALERHATAKLSSESDLAAIRSLGFRGEALPSISSVAALSLTSRIASLDQAARLVFDPETEQSEFKPAAHPVGTTVEVRNLFHSTPARKKFLRSERTEFLHILEMVRRLALSRSDVSIELRHNEQKALTCRAAAGELDGRVASLMGEAFIRKSIALDYAVGDMRVWGWLGVGDLARSTTDRQYFYLNGRMIRDKRLNHAVRLACENQIASGRFPSYVLYLELDVAAADVNVHPTKHEVRFRHARDVHDFLYAALSTALAEDQNLCSATSSVAVGNEQFGSPVNEEYQYPRRHNIVGEVKTSYGELYGKRQTELIGDTPALGQALVQIQQGHMLTQRGDESLLINIKAAKKHIALTRLQSMSASSPLIGRPLLVPVSFNISEVQAYALTQLSPLLAEYAMQLEPSGPASCLVRSIPASLEDADMALLVDDILNLDVTGVSTKDCRDSLIKIMVAHVCDIPNPAMNKEDMENVLRQLEHSGLDTSLSKHAPIWITLTAEDLDRLLNVDG
jgi:DNA mismatch repair protein MutL